MGKLTLPDLDTNEVSDGFHTFGELYAHRCRLYVLVCRLLRPELGGNIWRSRLHSDGTGFDGWFILGIFRGAGKQITYHLPDAMWADTEFAKYNTLDRAPEYDGHTAADVLERLKAL